MSLETRLTRNPQELDAIYRLRFEVYYQELGSRLPADVIAAGQLQDELDQVAYHYASFVDGQVVGCLRVVDLKDISDEKSLIDKYKLHDVINEWGRDIITFTGRMTVGKQFRKSSLVHRLMALATDDGRQRGMRICFLDCSPHLLPFYEAVGFKRYAPAFSDPVFGFKQPLIFIGRDAKSLQEIGSSLAKTSHYEDDPAMREWYKNRYTTYSANQTATLLPCGAFTDLVQDVIGGNLSELVPLFRDLCKEEIDLVLKKSTVVRAQSGDIVIRPGLHEPFMCVVLSGLLETTHAGHHLGALVRGDLYGETEFLSARTRMIEVVARETTDLLILPTEHLAQLIEKDVLIGRTLMKNLAIVMATRAVSRLEVIGILSSPPCTREHNIPHSHEQQLPSVQPAKVPHAPHGLMRAEAVTLSSQET